MDVRLYNRHAWDRQVEKGNRWTIPVGPEAVGVLLAGFVNPALYLFDDALAEKGELVVRHAVPYSDMDSLTEEERRRYTDRDEPLVYGHTLEDQVGGQLDAGFVLSGFYED